MKTAVLLIDMQALFLKQLPAAHLKVLVANQNRVIDLCAKRNIPLYVFEYKAGGIMRGPTIKALRDNAVKVSGHRIVIKDNNSCFTDTDLHESLQGRGIKALVLMGINSNACVQDTAISALARGYKVVSALGLTASAPRGNLTLSRRNEAWYRSKNIFAKDVDAVLKLLS